MSADLGIIGNWLSLIVLGLISWRLLVRIERLEDTARRVVAWQMLAGLTLHSHEQGSDRDMDERQ